MCVRASWAAEKAEGSIPIARQVILEAVPVLFNALEHRPIGDTIALQKTHQVLHAEMAVRAAVRLARPRRVLGQDLLAAEGTVPPAPPVRIATHVAVHVPDVVSVFLVEGVIGDLVEALSPEEETLLHVQADTLEEETVLEPAKMFEVGVPPEGAVEMRHAHGKVLRECVDVARRYLGASRRRTTAVAGIWSGKILGEVVKDRRDTVVLV